MNFKTVDIALQKTFVKHSIFGPHIVMSKVQLSKGPDSLRFRLRMYVSFRIQLNLHVIHRKSLPNF